MRAHPCDAAAVDRDVSPLQLSYTLAEAARRGDRVHVGAGWALLRASLGWTNVTLSEEAIALDCEHDRNGRPEAPCAVQHAPAIFLPSLGVRASF